jgi:hypothetical protein
MSLGGTMMDLQPTKPRPTILKFFLSQSVSTLIHSEVETTFWLCVRLSPGPIKHSKTYNPPIPTSDSSPRKYLIRFHTLSHGSVLSKNINSLRTTTSSLNGHWDGHRTDIQMHKDHTIVQLEKKPHSDVKSLMLT